MNWFKHILQILLIASGLNLVAQSNAYTSIQASANKYPDKDFYFQKVIDARKNKKNIGGFYKSDLRVKHSAQFKRPLSEELLTFLQNTYPNNNSANKIVVLVNDFEIDHLQSESTKDEGLVKADLDFYFLRNDSCFQILHFAQSLREPSDEPSLSQPNRIKRLFLLAVNEMEKEIDASKYKTTINRLVYDSLLQKGVSSIEKKNSKDLSENQPNYYFFQAGTYYSFSAQVMLFGLTTNLVLQLKNHPQYLIGANLNLKLYGAKTSDITDPTPAYAILNYDFGLKLLKQISPRLFININPQLVLGKTQKNVTSITVPAVTPTPSYPVETFMGIEVDFGAYLIPPKLPGVYTGLNFFFRSTNSSVFEEGFGIKLDLGYKF